MSHQEYGKEPVESETGTYIIIGANKPGDKVRPTSEIHKSISEPLPDRNEEKPESENE